MTLAELSALDRPDFVNAVGWVFEDSPWVAERAWEQRPFATVDRLHAAMVQIVGAAGRAAQVALLRAHPDLGARARMTAASAGEQAGAGLDCLTLHELERLQSLNAEYRRTFGFPFLFAVRGSTTHDVLEALVRRLARSPGDEFAEGLQQVSSIALWRLQSLVGQE